MTTPSDAGSWSANEGQPADSNLTAHGGEMDAGDQPAVPRELGSAAEEAPPTKPARRAPRLRFQTEEELQRSIDQVAVLRDEYIATSRLIAHAEADRARTLAKLQQLAIDESQSLREADVRMRSLAAECAVAMNMSDRTVLTQMNDSHRLVTDYPATFEALDAGKVTLPHARAVLSEGLNVAGEHLPEYEQLCLEAAVGASPGRLQRKAREIADRLTPRSIDERHRTAAAERRVWYRDLPDGMAEAGIVLPAVLILGIRDRVDQIAKASKAEALSVGNGQQATGELLPDDASSGNGWSLDAYRADVFAELLLTGVPSALPGGTALATGVQVPDAGDAGEAGDADRQNLSEGYGTTHKTRQAMPTAVQRHAAGIQGRVSITIPPGGAARLDGYGPIDSATARHLATAAPGWDQIHLDADGAVLATSRRQPTEAMRRILRARDQHCRYPGCFVPVDACEIDHTLDWAKGGPTEITNLGNLCPKHHMLKHPDLPRSVRWDAYQDSNGVFTWVSPTGATYLTTPEGSIVSAPAQTPLGRQIEAGPPAEWPWGRGFEDRPGEGVAGRPGAGVGVGTVAGTGTDLFTGTVGSTGTRAASDTDGLFPGERAPNGPDHPMPF